MLPTREIKLFEYIIAEVFSSGGDGDCTIICKDGKAEELANKFYGFLSTTYPNYHFDKFEYGFLISDRSNESWLFSNNQIDVAEWCQCLIKV